jgi:hypothetical protein
MIGVMRDATGLEPSGEKIRTGALPRLEESGLRISFKSFAPYLMDGAL